MPTGPAARITDNVMHPLPPVLTPGPGSMNVLIGFLPAWRGLPLAAVGALMAAKNISEAAIKTAEAATIAAAGTPGAPAAKLAEETVKATAAATMGSMISSMAGMADIHLCTTPLPIPPHGPGVVIDGSPTVMINNLQACRLGDTIIEAVGPPNKIVKGEFTVIIGQSGSGGGGGGMGGLGGGMPGLPDAPGIPGAPPAPAAPPGGAAPPGATPGGGGAGAGGPGPSSSTASGGGSGSGGGGGAAPPASPGAGAPAPAPPGPTPIPYPQATTQEPEKRKQPEKPDPPLKPPASRHYAARVKQKTLAKAQNTVIEPGVDVMADVAAINAGQAVKISGNFVVNGRTYGFHDGTLFPIAGPGFHQLQRGAFKALGVMNQLGLTDKGNEILDKMGISAEDRAAAKKAYDAAKKAQDDVKKAHDAATKAHDDAKKVHDAAKKAREEWQK
jgi:hypothetical protein